MLVGAGELPQLVRPLVPLDIADRGADAGGASPTPSPDARVASPTAVPERGLSLPLGATLPDPVVRPTNLPAGDGVSGFQGEYLRPTPKPTPRPTPVPVTRAPSAPSSGSSAGGGGWRVTGASWYGPGFYGSGTACGQTYSMTIIGVAHRTLPCGTLVQFRHNGRVMTAPVIDRGPFGVAGRDFDLSRALCVALVRCHTAPIEWRFP